jgi:hypothetical protein
MMRSKKTRKKGLPRDSFWGCKLKAFHVALKNVRDFHNFLLIQNNSELFDAVCRVRILSETQASQSRTYVQKTLLHHLV